jgi:hypothetical protein
MTLFLGFVGRVYSQRSYVTCPETERISSLGEFDLPFKRLNTSIVLSSSLVPCHLRIPVLGHLEIFVLELLAIAKVTHLLRYTTFVD